MSATVNGIFTKTIPTANGTSASDLARKFVIVDAAKPGMLIGVMAAMSGSHVTLREHSILSLSVNKTLNKFAWMKAYAN